MHTSTSSELAVAFGNLVRQARINSYSQSQLAARIGVSRNPIAALEAGKSVSTATLFDALEFLGIADDVLDAINQQLDGKNARSRKSRIQAPELDNDF